MKKHDDKTADADDLPPEIDFSNLKAERGKYYQRYRQGHTLRIRREDGSVDVQHFTLDDGAVMLDPDVRAYFPDSDAVNRALRTLIELVPERSASPEPTKA